MQINWGFVGRIRRKAVPSCGKISGKREPVRFPFCMNLLNILKYFFRPLLKNIRRLNQSLEHFQCRRIVVSVADPLVGDRLDVDEAAAVYYAVRSMVLTEYLVP